ncbi:MAG: MaoC family dehydratase [Bacteroidaceae bacterium]|nr:MaoC family dehydratase [Paraprevotella sp.]MDY4785821.1 MaoC family dehydratase [Bacteroidaceae bacterium]MDY5078254.1 MaoC family dehydratase [Bacteroidaceae bacterium]MDY5191629.1 MaoC family dehydratase [Bacteroidaceae bacterium]
MDKLIINSYEDFEQYVGKELGASGYVQLSQERINLFADATLDHQWIHVDTEKAKAESPFGTTIAHGYLTMSMLPYLWDQIVEVNNLERMMNYGMDKMKFAQPVLSGQHVRMVTRLQELANLRGAVKTTIKFTIEVQETGKKALEGLATFIYYFRPADK